MKDKAERSSGSRRGILSLALAVMLAATGGCGTAYNLGFSPGGPTLYGGVGRDIELLGPEGKDKGAAVLLVPFDFVLSLVLDTATLPITLLCGFFGWQRSKSQQ